jgi:hypothetical protein
LQDEGEENPGFVEDEEPAREEECEDFEEDPKFKKILETISENQNSPYSTQASHNNSRYKTTPPAAATTPQPLYPSSQPQQLQVYNSSPSSRHNNSWYRHLNSHVPATTLQEHNHNPAADTTIP